MVGTSIWAIVEIAIVYSMFWLFERKRLQFDFFDVATVVVAPLIAYVLLGFGLSVLSLGIWGSAIAELTLLVLTFVLLKLVVSVTTGRAVLYSIVIYFVQMVPGILLMAGA